MRAAAITRSDIQLIDRIANLDSSLDVTAAIWHFAVFLAWKAFALADSQYVFYESRNKAAEYIAFGHRNSR